MDGVKPALQPMDGFEGFIHMQLHDVIYTRTPEMRWKVRDFGVDFCSQKKFCWRCPNDVMCCCTIIKEKCEDLQMPIGVIDTWCGKRFTQNVGKRSTSELC